GRAFGAEPFVRKPGVRAHPDAAFGKLFVQPVEAVLEPSAFQPDLQILDPQLEQLLVGQGFPGVFPAPHRTRNLTILSLDGVMGGRRRQPAGAGRAGRSASLDNCCYSGLSPMWILRPSLAGSASMTAGNYLLWIGSIQATCSGFSAGSMSRLTTTGSLSLRTSTHSSGSSGLALISWCGTEGGTKMKSPGPASAVDSSRSPPRMRGFRPPT